MSAQRPSESEGLADARPDPRFAVLGARPLANAAAPTLVFELAASDASGREVYAIALTAQVFVEPAKRRYGEETRALLVDLFGAPERWALTTQSFQLWRADVLVPSFRGQTTFELHVPCTYDLEVAAAKYFYALDDGEVPLAFHLSGSIFYRGERDRLQVVKVPWTAVADHLLPVATWQAMIAQHYAPGGFVRLGAETLRHLQERRSAGGFRSFDDCVADLLERSGEA
jgi:hypothetical protein